MVGVPTDLLEGDVEAIDGEPAGGGEGAAPLEEAGAVDARAEHFSRLDARGERQEEIVLVPGIARACDAGREVEGTGPVGRVCVLVMQSGQDGPAAAIDDGGAGRRYVRADTDDLVAVDDDRGRFADRSRGRVEHARVREVDGTRIAVAHRGGQSVKHFG